MLFGCIACGQDAATTPATQQPPRRGGSPGTPAPHRLEIGQDCQHPKSSFPLKWQHHPKKKMAWPVLTSYSNKHHHQHHHHLRRLPWHRRFSAKAIRGPEPGAQVLEPLHLTPALRAPTGRPSTFSSVFLCLSLSFCLSSLEVAVASLPPPHLCRIAVFSIKPTFLSANIPTCLSLSS